MQIPNLRAVVRDLQTRATLAFEQFKNPVTTLSARQYLALAIDQGRTNRSRPPTDELQDLPVNTVPTWTVQQIQGAVQAHVVGNFGLASMLTESMLADDRIQSATNGRIKGITKSTVTMQPALSGGKRRQTVAKEVEALWPELFPEQTVEQLLTWMIFMGWALMEMIWEDRDNTWVPRLKVWHPLYVWYDISARQYVVNTATGPVYVDPNDPKWFLYTPFGAYRGWLRGAVRSCAIPWIVRQYALRDWARYSEIHGLPQKKVKYPAQAPAEAKAAFFASIKRLGAETAFSLPQQAGKDAAAWDVELLEATDKSWAGFQGLIGQCDSSITLAIRGTNLTTEVTGGSFAAAQTHRDEDSDYAEADIKKFAAAVQRQVLSWYCLYNYGDANLAPLPMFKGQANFTLNPTSQAAVVTVNEARSAVSLGPLMGLDGEERPEGFMTIGEMEAALQAAAQQTNVEVDPTADAGELDKQGVALPDKDQAEDIEAPE